MASGIRNTASFTVIAEQDPVLDFAAEELRAYAARMLPQGAPQAEACNIYLGCSEAFFARHGLDRGALCRDGYTVCAVEGGWALASLLPRGVLFAVYDVLRANGCRFIKAAGVEEIVPRCEELVFAPRLENPDLEIRGLTIGVSEVNADWEKQTECIVDWAAKNRLNMIFLHESVDLPFGEANHGVVEAVYKRGMLLEFGGHGIQNYVPRTLFDAHPEYFIEKDGKRAKSGNFCVSSKEALELAAARLLSYLRSCPGVRVLHIWFEDTIAGSWCTCASCREKLPVQQMSEAVSFFAERIRGEFPHVKLDLLLYHDTLDKIDGVAELPENVVVEFAARERCYGHPIDAADCKLNRTYLRKLDACIRRFGAEKIALFEYYMDFILFSKAKTVLAHTIAADLRCYAQRGIRSVSPLSFGLYSFWAYDVNLYVYAAHAFHTDRSAEETLAAFLADFSLPQGYAAYLAEMERFTALYFSFCGYEHCYDDIRGLPICPYFDEHLQKIGEAIACLYRASALLASLQKEARGAAASYLDWEAKILDITLSECTGLRLRMTTRSKNYHAAEKGSGALVRDMESVKTGLYGILDKIRKIPPGIKGVQGGTLFEEHLCKDQIWTVNELLNKEFEQNVDLDRSGI